MAVLIGRQVRDGETVGTGVNSPIPAAGVLLARELQAPSARLRMPGAESAEPFHGSKEFFDMAQRGRVDLFFLSGVQVDRRGNINLHLIGEYERPERRFAGAFGSAVLYYVVPRVIVFRVEHSPRTLVERVDFVTAAGGDGRPNRVITSRATLVPGAAGELELAEHAPGETVESVRAATGWDLRAASGEHASEPPGERELELLRGPVYDQLARVYPRYVERRRAGTA
jgi:glutaconate CoA-transferase, subunit B